jgi:hypothetical protein
LNAPMEDNKKKRRSEPGGGGGGTEDRRELEHKKPRQPAGPCWFCE